MAAQVLEKEPAQELSSTEASTAEVNINSQKESQVLDSQRTSDEENNLKEEAQEQLPPRDIHGWKWILAVTAILSSIFYYALDNTVVADIQPVIISDFGNVDKMTWLSVAFLLGATATNLVWGRIYGQFNAKWTYLLNVAVFEIGSAICGAAPSIQVMIVGRALCGVSGSGLYVGVMTLLATTTTIAERPLYIGGTGLTWGVGIVLGPIIGGAFSDSSAGWRWAFYINLCIGACAAPVYLFLLPNKDPRPGVSIKDRARELDFIGSLLSIAAFTTGIMAISWGGMTYPWNSGPVIGLFVCSGVLFIILGIQQVWTIGTTVERRIIPVEFFGSRTVLILFSATAAAGAAAFVPIYMVPIFFQFTRNDAALEAGVRLLPFIIIMVATIFTNGALLAKWGLYMPWYTAGGALTLTGGALMYTVGLTTSTAHVYGYTAITGLGVGLFIQASFSVAQAVVTPSRVPAAVGFITLAQFAGITIAMTIANSLYLNGSETRIAEILPNVSKEEIQLAMTGVKGTFLDSLGPGVSQEVLTAIVDAISKTYALEITAGALVFVLSFLMKRERLFVESAAVAAA
ncbi:hypothetical protein UA08_08056 [Talaromyces atroroseus]|uniref:Major facilitator superfamily (MFS) profile domain-containing protein n=1 Tax=Talaromyces atroroseus TaxID=1441469 RepID=A0A225AHA1_TALAT|nr:hypothetical protein UA08_08056 [Talaromyces atroroseus]OKL56408.1 hypothetical protein UA08_08056 [Talaromyces atroroseus]